MDRQISMLLWSDDPRGGRTHEDLMKEEDEA